MSEIAGFPLEAVVSSRGLMAFALAEGGVALRALSGEAPTLAETPEVGESRVAFHADGLELAVLRAGRVHTYALPDPGTPVPSPPARPGQTGDGTPSCR